MEYLYRLHLSCSGIVLEEITFHPDPDTLSGGVFQQRIDKQIATSPVNGQKDVFKFSTCLHIAA